MPRPNKIRPCPDVSTVMSVEDFLTTWHAANEHHSHFMLDESAMTTRTRICRDIIPVIGDVPIGLLDGPTLNEPAFRLNEAGAHDDAAAAQKVMLAAFSAAERHGLLDPELVAERHLFGMMQLRDSSGWTIEDLVQMGIPGGRQDAFDAFQLMVVTDLEPHEVVALRWGDLQKRRLHVRNALALVDDRPTLVRATPLSGERIIRLDDTEEELFDDHRLLQTLHPDYSTGTSDRDLIFPGPNGGLQTPWALQEAMNEHTDHVDAPRISLTDIRYLLPMLRTLPELLGEQVPGLDEQRLDAHSLAA